MFSIKIRWVYINFIAKNTIIINDLIHVSLSFSRMNIIKQEYLYILANFFNAFGVRNKYKLSL